MDEAEYIRSMIAKKCRHEIHVSERKSFRGCRRRWNWIFRENHYPPITVQPLEFGVAFHHGFEVLHNPATWSYNHLALGALAEKAFVEDCERQRAEYLRARNLYCLEGEEEENYDERIRLGRGMIWYYVKNHLSKLQDEYTITHVEVSFDVPLTDESGKQLYCKCKACRKDFAKAGGGYWRGNPVVFSGRTDAIARDIDGSYWIWDWKTAAQFRDIDVFLELDDQVCGYVFALRLKMNLDIRGFIYFEVKKGFPEPPKENKHIRLGRAFSVATNQDTDYETYKACVAKYDKDAYEAGLYNYFLEWLLLEGPKYYRKHVVYKSDYELEQYGKNLLLEVQDMLDPNLRIYLSPGRFGCNTCAFQTPCIMKNAGQDYEYTLETLYVRMEPYYRRIHQKPSTETKGAE